MNIRLKDFQFMLLGFPILILALVIPNQYVGMFAAVFFALYTFLTPKNGLLLLLLYFPTRPFLVEINPSLKLIGDLIIVAAFARIVFDSRKNLKSLFQLHAFEWGFILFCALGAISAYLTGVSLGAIIFQLRAFLITYIVFYVVKRLDITKEDVIKFLWTTFFMALLLSIHGLIEKLSIRTLLMPEKWVLRSLSHNNRIRIYGLIDNPNVLATYLSIAFMLTMYLKQFVRQNLMWLINIGIVLILGAMTLTYSRGTWIGWIVAIVVYMVLTKNWKVFTQTAIVLVTAVLLINLPTAAGARYIATTGFGDIERTYVPESEDGETDAERRLKETFQGSTLELSMKTGRLFVVMKGFAIFKDHPIIGTGFGTFGDSATKSYSSPIIYQYGMEKDIYSDNQYIQVIAQTGIIGVILFAIFLLGMLALLWKKRIEMEIAKPLLALLAAVFVVGVLYNIWEDKTFTTYYFMMLGVVAGGYSLKRKNLI